MSGAVNKSFFRFFTRAGSVHEEIRDAKVRALLPHPDDLDGGGIDVDRCFVSVPVPPQPRLPVADNELLYAVLFVLPGLLLRPQRVRVAAGPALAASAIAGAPRRSAAGIASHSGDERLGACP
jgi:hypothetical protein